MFNGVLLYLVIFENCFAFLFNVKNYKLDSFMSGFKVFDFPFILPLHLLAVLTIGVFYVYSKLCTTKSCEQDIFQLAKAHKAFIPGGLDHFFLPLHRLLLKYFHFSNVVFFQRDRITSFRKTGTKKEKPFIQHPTDPISTQAELPQPQPFFDERSMNLSEKEIVDLFEKMMEDMNLNEDRKAPLRGKELAIKREMVVQYISATAKSITGSKVAKAMQQKSPLP
ncbi:uncharacterized protein LOC106941183 isoform X2 [Poecilia latipinna]|uniref:uncharacterized protein LOC106941183 isoform X2 n=1 Tax=Poecilia latipinna TaxID=48699 RepID=UPI00072E7795|nr:PREDICTED: uncharacterized protein LOC106941183 isoform X2 [Poecilia latipinna]